MKRDFLEKVLIEELHFKKYEDKLVKDGIAIYYEYYYGGFLFYIYKIDIKGKYQHLIDIQNLETLFENYIKNRNKKIIFNKIKLYCS